MAPSNTLDTLLHAQRQHGRLLKLAFPHDDAPAGSQLVANRLEADEGLSRDFEYTVDVLSLNPAIPLKEVLGKMVTVELVRDDGKVRYFNGYVFDFRFLKHDAGFAHYQMTLRPWLAFLRQRRNNCIFHGKTLEEQTHHILDAYPMHDWQTRQLGPDAPMSDAVQFAEDDHNYLHRRWEAQGWTYWYEHRKDGHTLVLCGDATDEDLLEQENIAEMDLFLALTNDDEDNIMAASLAKRLGCQRVLALIDAVDALGIDPADVAPEHWRHVHNRLSAGQEPNPYTPERHAAWVSRRRIAP